MEEHEDGEEEEEKEDEPGNTDKEEEGRPFGRVIFVHLHGTYNSIWTVEPSSNITNTRRGRPCL